MFIHVAVFRWQEGVGADHVQTVTEALRTLPAQIPTIRSYRVGPDLNLPGGWDFAVVVEFDDEARWRTHQDHPAHDDVRKNLIGQAIADRAVVQFEAL